MGEKEYQNLEVCGEKHGRVNEILTTHENRLNNHSNRIDSLEQNKSRVEVQIEELCRDIRSLAKSIKWGTGALLTALAGFFVWYVQNLNK